MKDYYEKYNTLLNIQNYCCASCGEMFFPGQKIDLAHKIKASKFNYKEFGEDVIDHILNLAATHHNGYNGKACNDKQNMSRATNPIEANKLIEKIREDLKR